MNYPMLDDGTRDWCRTCAHYVGACESDCTYQRNENGLDYDKEPTMYQQKPISNADRIRAMNDEELADFIARQRFSAVNPIADILGIDVTTEFIVGRKNALDWLRQEDKRNE